MGLLKLPGPGEAILIGPAPGPGLFNRIGPCPGPGEAILIGPAAGPGLIIRIGGGCIGLP